MKKLTIFSLYEAEASVRRISLEIYFSKRGEVK